MNSMIMQGKKRSKKILETGLTAGLKGEPHPSSWYTEACTRGHLTSVIFFCEQNLIPLRILGWTTLN